MAAIIRAGLDAARTATDSLLTSLNPELGAGLALGFSQPLLRDFKIDPARAQLDLSRSNRTLLGSRFRETSVNTSADAERGYWGLVAALALVNVQQRALDLALELERNNRARVDVGQSPPLDLVAARAEVAQRQENLIIARTVALQVEDTLRTIIIDPNRADYWLIRLEPADRVPVVAPPPDVDAAVRRALGERTDLERARTEIQITDTTVALSKSQTLPDLRVQANYLGDGAGGTRLIREGGFPGTVVGSVDTSFGSVLGQVFSGDYPTWTLGVTFSYPLGNSTAEANLARARLERDQAAARLRSSEVGAVREVRQAALRLEQNRQRIETTKLGRELAEQRLDAEQRRFEVGMSTSFLVIQAQRDLAIASNGELQALLDYQLAVIAFETSQQTSTARLLAVGRRCSVVLRSCLCGETVRPRHRQRRIVAILEDEVGDEHRRQRGQEHAVAEVARRVDESFDGCRRSDDREPVRGRGTEARARVEKRRAPRVRQQLAHGVEQVAHAGSRRALIEPHVFDRRAHEDRAILPRHHVTVLAPDHV